MDFVPLTSHISDPPSCLEIPLTIPRFGAYIYLAYGFDAFFKASYSSGDMFQYLVTVYRLMLSMVETRFFLNPMRLSLWISAYIIQSIILSSPPDVIINILWSYLYDCWNWLLKTAGF